MLHTDTSPTLGLESHAAMVAHSIKGVYDHHCVNLKIDAKFAKEIIRFDVNFITKNADHVNFFGSGLLGVYPIRWTDDERNRWLDDILQIDEIALKDDVHSLPTINPDHKVATDIVNLSFVYVIHRLANEKTLPGPLKADAIRSTIAIMHYKFLTSLMVRNFPYPADEAVAKATFNELSLKFDIKKLGSWGQLIRSRAEENTKPSALHYHTFLYMRDDAAVQYMVSDIQTRIREVVKAQVIVFYRIRETNGKIVSTSSVMTTDDGFTVKDVRRTHNQYHNYLMGVITEPRDFIRRELLDVVMALNPSANPDTTTNALKYLSSNYSDRRKTYIKSLVEDLLIYTFNFIRTKRIPTHDLKEIAIRLRAMFTGSRINDKAILELRDLTDRLVYESLPKRTGVPISPERTAVMLYTVLRALTKNYYS